MARTKQTKRGYPTVPEVIASKQLKIENAQKFEPPVYPSWGASLENIQTRIPDDLILKILLFSLDIIFPNQRRSWVKTFGLVSKDFGKQQKIHRFVKPYSYFQLTIYLGNPGGIARGKSRLCKGIYSRFRLALPVVF
jgi:hypothetical protein